MKKYEFYFISSILIIGVLNFLLLIIPDGNFVYLKWILVFLVLALLGVVVLIYKFYISKE